MDGSNLNETLFANLETIDWGSLQHAYGPAQDVPELLRDLADPKALTREIALYKLSGNIWHQGTVYEAAAYAVPFLLELLDAELAIEKHEILIFLSDLATGNSYHKAHQNFILFRDRRDDPEFRAAIERELIPVRSTRAAVCAGTLTYERLLSDPSPETRAAAAYLLGIAPESPEQSLELLRERFGSAEPPDIVRVAAVLATGYLKPQTPASIAFLSEVCSTAEVDRPCRVAAALGLVASLGREAPNPVKEVLLEVATDPGDLDRIFSSLPWDTFEIHGLACISLSLVSDDLEEVLPLLAMAISRPGSTEIWRIAHVLLGLVFPQPIGAETTAAALTSQQQSAIAAIADSDQFWIISDDHSTYVCASEVLQAFGLPDRRAAIHLFLEGNLTCKAAAALNKKRLAKRWWKFWY